MRPIKLLCLSLPFLFFFVAPGYSQSVGINYNAAAPNSAAALDIDVSALGGVKKGLLIPRVSLADRTAMNPLAVAAQGLVVYQTDGVQGFYYNTSTTTTPNWIYLANSGSGGIRWDQLQDPTGSLNLAHGANTTTMSFNGVTNATAFGISSNSLTSGELLHLSVNSGAAPASGQVGVLSVVKSGTNTNTNVTSAGIYTSVTNTGTGSINTGGYFTTTGAEKNYSLYATTDAANSYALFGINNSVSNASNYGILGTTHGNTASGSGYGVTGRADGTGTYNYGGFFYAAGASSNSAVQANTDANGGFGVYGWNYSTGIGNQIGISGNKTGNTGTGTGYGVYGSATGTGTFNAGGDFYASGATNNAAVNATTDADGGYAVNAQNSSTGTGSQYGIYGSKYGNTITGTGYGVYGIATGTGTNNYGGFFSASGANNNEAVHGEVNTNVGVGVYGLNNSTATGGSGQYGVYGSKTGNTGSNVGYGVYGNAQGTATANYGGFFQSTGATSNGYGVYSNATGGGTTASVVGGFFYASGGSVNNFGVQGTTDANNGIGVWGVNSSTGPGTQYGVYGLKNGAATGAGVGIYGVASGIGTINTGGYFTAFGATNNYAAIFEQGNVGIGCLSPQYKLQVSGDIAASGILYASSAVVSTAFTACSDIRYKKNVTPLQNSLANLMKLQGVSYYWKTKEFPDKYFNDKKQIGVIAQELEKVYPELVMTDKDGYKSVDYSKITPILIEAIKDQQKEIADQQKQFEDYKKETNKKIDDLIEMIKKQQAGTSSQQSNISTLPVR